MNRLWTFFGLAVLFFSSSSAFAFPAVNLGTHPTELPRTSQPERSVEIHIWPSEHLSAEELDQQIPLLVYDALSRLDFDLVRNQKSEIRNGSYIGNRIRKQRPGQPNTVYRYDVNDRLDRVNQNGTIFDATRKGVSSIIIILTETFSLLVINFDPSTPPNQVCKTGQS